MTTTTRRRVEHPVSAGGVVCRRMGDEVEVVICGRHSPEGWVWGLPKGTPDSGETVEEAATREVTEETGLEVTIEAPIASIRYWFVRPTDGVRCHKTVHFFLMSPVGGSTTEHDLEFDMVQWAPRGKAIHTLTYKNEANILKKAVKMMSHPTQSREKLLIRGERTILREKRLEDAPLDYAWRADEELSGLDATTPLKTPYSDFLRLFQDELRHPVPWSQRFAVETHDGKLIGNCMYYDIDTVRGQTELGIMIGDKGYWDQGYGTDIVKTLVNHIFTTTSLKRIYLHTLTRNLRAQRAFQKCGFVPVRKVSRSGYDFILMELLRDRWDMLKKSTSQKGEPLVEEEAPAVDPGAR